MIRLNDLKQWAEFHAIGRSTTFPDGWISGEDIKSLGALVTMCEPEPCKYTGSRKNLLDAKRDITTVLLAMEGIGDEITDHAAALAMARAIWIALDWIVRGIDKTERDESEHNTNEEADSWKQHERQSS